jgi:hypothetical protein
VNVRFCALVAKSGRAASGQIRRFGFAPKTAKTMHATAAPKRTLIQYLARSGKRQKQTLMQRAILPFYGFDIASTAAT